MISHKRRKWAEVGQLRPLAKGGRSWGVEKQPQVRDSIYNCPVRTTSTLGNAPPPMASSGGAGSYERPSGRFRDFGVWERVANTSLLSPLLPDRTHVLRFNRRELGPQERSSRRCKTDPRPGRAEGRLADYLDCTMLVATVRGTHRVATRSML